MNNISLKDLRISHARYDRALNQMLEAIELAGSDGTCIPFLGPTRVGKSDLISAVKSQVSKDRYGPGYILPTPDFLYGEISPKPNDSELYASVIRTMGRVGANSKLPLLQDRMYDLLEQRDVRIVALDECSHCAEPGANLTRRAAADHFKTIIDRSGVILILMGLPKAQRLIDENEQFAARSMATIELNPYRWTNPDDRNEFTTVIYSIFDYLEERGISLEFDWIDMSRRLFAASGGRVGMVIELLQVAVRSTARDGVLAMSGMGKAADIRLQGLSRLAPIFNPDPPQDDVLLRSYAKVMRDAGLQLPDPNSSLEIDAFRAAQEEALAA
ncbi:TniB protein [Roseovarius nanhaiticus]|uniref:TniB protein n=1 Tax=Roseovarius nanhaiticus TaxID=573024 RepID=A0A1N7HKG7_9RHOB|nr:TniB family NTP-binding protein [Roseovarius nanhaiticus]SEL25728.1 TniB protein [Roseovarius nanhaiticus]SIS25359.1 TniB protein [Roseovarius nanhaiticus]